MDFSDFLIKNYNISGDVISMCREAEERCAKIFSDIDKTARFNALKVLWAMQKNRLGEAHLSRATGYGYDDMGRDIIEKIYADVFGCEEALVRPQIISGTHALALALGGNLRYGDGLLSPAGQLYDTMQGVIGIKPAKNSLIENGIAYKQIGLNGDGSFNYKAIEEAVTKKTKLALIQRSRGYEWRQSFTVPEINKLVLFLKGIKPDIICLIDNCYGEFTDTDEPEADIIAGSLIKNPGGGMAITGGYITGREEFVLNAADRLTAPGVGKEIGPNLGLAPSVLQGLFVAPDVVANCLKSAVLAAVVFEKLGYDVMPAPFDKRSDIVQSIKFNNPDTLKRFCRAIQSAAPVDSFATPTPAPMPGYEHDVIMAAGTFTQGSSIELSADGPLREPYTAHLQGGLTYNHARIGIMIAADRVR